MWGDDAYSGHFHDLSIPALKVVLMVAWSVRSCQGGFFLISFPPSEGRSFVFLACARVFVGEGLAVPLIVVELPLNFEAVPSFPSLFLLVGEEYLFSFSLELPTIFYGSFTSCSASKFSPRSRFLWEVCPTWDWDRSGSFFPFFSFFPSVGVLAKLQGSLWSLRLAE